jgi:hypothetical protein
MSVKNQYVDNKKFYQAMCEYKNKVKESKELGKPKPRIPEYVGECILLIANNFSNYWKFKNYSYKDEMVGRAIETCIKYIDNFDTDKYNNPHAYFTQVCYRAFQFKIKEERKQLYIKYKNAQNSFIFDELCESLEDSNHELTFVDMSFEKTNLFIQEYEKSLTKKKKKSKVGVEKFLEDTVNE